MDISVGNLQYYFSSKDDLVEAVISDEIGVSLDLATGADWDAADLQTSVTAVVRAILRHHASEAGQFYAIAEGRALHHPRFAALKARGYAQVFEQVAVLVKAQRPDLDATRSAGLATVLVALIDGASLQIQFGKVAVTPDVIDTLSDDVATAITHLLQHWS